MATDRFFAKHIHESDRPLMRVYAWQPGCISLGYHQKVDCINLAKCRESGVDVVRRPTGGRAVYHAEEVTYSVILPVDWLSNRDAITDTYQQLSAGLVTGLRLIGIPAEFAKRHVDLKFHYETQESVSCFSAAALHEIVVHDRKIVGSAQRRWPRAVLQHGSILSGTAHLDLLAFLTDLSPSVRRRFREELESKTTSISQELDREVTYDEIVQAIRQGMMETLGIRFEACRLSDKERREIVALEDGFSLLENRIST